MHRYIYKTVFPLIVTKVNVSINLIVDFSLNICMHIMISPPQLTGDQRVLFEVARQHQTEEDGETQNKEVPGGIEVHKLQVGQSHRCDHTEQGAEQSSQDRVRQRGKQGAKFTHKP